VAQSLSLSKSPSKAACRLIETVLLLNALTASHLHLLSGYIATSPVDVLSSPEPEEGAAPAESILEPQSALMAIGT
jgi:hypothetical protein